MVAARTLAAGGSSIEPRIRGAWLRGDRLTLVVDCVDPGTRHMMDTLYGGDDDLAA
jgi:hypothetical protein